MCDATIAGQHGKSIASQGGRLTATSAISTLSVFEPEFTVINEPGDYYGRLGDTTTFIAEAEGTNLG